MKMIIENIANSNFIKSRPYKYFDFNELRREVVKNLKLNYDLSLTVFKYLDC